MLSTILVSVVLFLGFFFVINATNTNLECTTNSALVSQINFNPGVIDVNRNIKVTGKTSFSDCTLNGTNYGTGKLIINNKQPLSFSCALIFTHSLTAYVSFSFDNYQKHYVTLIPSANPVVLLPNNWLSFLSNVIYTGTISPKLNGADQLTVVINYVRDIIPANPAFNCIWPGLKRLNGAAVLTLE